MKKDGENFLKFDFFKFSANNRDCLINKQINTSLPLKLLRVRSNGVNTKGQKEGYGALIAPQLYP